MKDSLKKNHFDNEEARILEFLNSLSNRDIFEEKWQLKEAIVDFGLLDQLGNRSNQKGWMFNKIVKNTVKVLCIELSRDDLQSNHIKISFDVIFLAILFISKHKLNEIDPEHFSTFIEFYCLNTIQRSAVHIRQTPRSASTTYLAMSTLLSTNTVLEGFDLSPIVQHVPPHHIKKYMKQAISSLTSGELTYADWTSGSSFNYLTLDYGKYYLEYCQKFFSDNISIAAALNHLMDNKVSYIESVGMKYYSNTRNLFHKLLSGISVKEVASIKGNNIESCQKLMDLIETEYQKFLLPMLKRESFLSSNWIARLLYGSDANREDISENVSIALLRNIISLAFDEKHNDLVMKTLSDHFPNLKLNRILEILDEIELPHQKLKLPTRRFYEDLGLSMSHGGKNLCDIFVRRVRSAGITCVVAITGWRGSEYAFPMSAINITDNLDVLDMKEYPVRVSVKWHVFKTNGDALVDREITLKIYEMIRKLEALTSTKTESSPCLFDLDPRAQKSKDSYGPISTAVCLNWSNFVEKYDGFILLDKIDEYDRLCEKDIAFSLSGEEQESLSGLKIELDVKNISSIRNDYNLRKSRNIARSQLSRVLFLQERTQHTRQSTIYGYHQYLNGKNNQLTANVIEMFNEFLPKHLITTIKNASIDLLRNPLFPQDVMGALIEGCLYVTPHALRHMWAEAVYRRFDGDVGWMVRSNFKHITRSMWLSYISGKDQLRHVEDIKTRVASALLANWLRSRDQNYAGKMNKFLRRIFTNTSFIASDSVDTFIERFASVEIESIKANPWGFCISRRKTMPYAQCSKNGTLNQQDATPTLCLNCINSLSNSSNADYLILSSYTHLELLESGDFEMIPDSFRRQSTSYLNSARQILEQLEPTNPMIERMRSASMI